MNKTKKLILNPIILKFQAVEQDRHVLKRKLISKESECDSKVLELQNDVAELSTKLATKEAALKQWERDKGSLVSELNAQNSRLTSQLKEATMVESQLQEQVQNLKEQCTLGRSNLQEHAASVDSLRDEVGLLEHKKNELERRLHNAAAERDNLATALEEASERILVMERHAREQEMRYQHSLQEYSLPQDKLSIEERIAGKFWVFLVVGFALGLGAGVQRFFQFKKERKNFGLACFRCW